MFRWILNKKAQNTAEYAILIALVVGAAVAMQTYVKRGLQGRVKDAVDHVGAAADVGGATLNFTGKQYEPYYIDRSFTTGRTRHATTEVKSGGGVEWKTGADAGGVDETVREGSQTYTGAEDSDSE